MRSKAPSLKLRKKPFQQEKYTKDMSKTIHFKAEKKIKLTTFFVCMCVRVCTYAYSFL